MLTARQQKFYVRIGLLASSTDITAMEKRNLERAKKWLDRGDEFQIVINTLCLGLQDLNSERLQGKLSCTAEKLLKDLIDIYGEPTRPEFVRGFEV
ncbi:hypothetical protein [Lactovum odontotermitis]